MRGFVSRYRLALVWIVILMISTGLQTFTVLDDAHSTGRSTSLLQALVEEGSSHVLWAVLLLPIYWLHRRFAIQTAPVNIVVHLAATIPVSLAHVFGMVGMRFGLSALLGLPFAYRFTLEQLFYEYRKDVMTYLIFSAAYMALNYIFGRFPQTAATSQASNVAMPPAKVPLARFAVRKKDREVLVSTEDIDWIEAAGNYAILHVGAEKHEIRSSLARLEDDLDPASFVRVHKSSIVNIARVREVEPWFSGDYRIRLHDNTEIPLSRRYRARFEHFVPVRR
ncbi:MAG: LytTR family DNA-binding domain-containing protein [Rhodospirillales bacterium]